MPVSKMLERDLYCTVLCQTFSPCGRYLAAGNCYGQIAIYNLDNVLNPPEDPSVSKNKKTADFILDVGKNIQICSLVSNKNFLIAGTCGEILGWDWKQIKKYKVGQPQWKIPIPDNRQNIDRPDVNSLWLKEDDGLLFVGCGDNNIYVFNITTGKLIKTYDGHTDYIHSIHGLNSTLVSASEDGTVKVWDVRTSKSCNNFAPHTDPKLARPDLGKWIGSASVSEDWIVCGGGPKLALYQLRSLQIASPFELPDHGIHVSYFHEDRIIAGGTAPHLYTLNFSGEVIAEIPVSATTVYSAIQQTTPHCVFTIAGSSPEIDFCTNFNYKDFTLNFKMS